MSSALLPPQSTDVIASLDQRVSSLEQGAIDTNAPIDLFVRAAEQYAYADVCTLTPSSASPYALCDAGFKVGFCLCQ